MQLDQNDLADFVAETIIDAVKPLQKQASDLHALIADLERRLSSLPDTRAVVAAELESIPRPRDGKDADPEAIMAAARTALAELPTPVDGKDADPAAIAEAVSAAVAALPKPQDGRSVTLDEVAPLVNEAVAKVLSEDDPVEEFSNALKRCFSATQPTLTEKKSIRVKREADGSLLATEV